MKKAANVRGAALAEFVVAIMPILMLIFCTAQYSVLAVAKIVTKHAAYVGARAAIVACTEPGASANGLGEVQNAVMVAYGPVLKLGKPTASITAGACSETSQSLLTVTVSAPLRCGVPLGGLLVCGGPTKTLTASATLPSQGTYANKVWGGK